MTDAALGSDCHCSAVVGSTIVAASVTRRPQLSSGWGPETELGILLADIERLAEQQLQQKRVLSARKDVMLPTGDECIGTTAEMPDELKSPRLTSATECTTPSSRHRYLMPAFAERRLR